ncbi:MAG: TolC family protein, partial [Longimicrobiales bacterium]|nr:TolC family protein [Longimicrobiales bacterium]
RRVEAASAALAAERADRLPRLDAGAALLDFGTLTGEHVLEWQAGVQLSWPVFTGGARSASLRRAEARLREAQAEREAVRLQLLAAEDAAGTALAEARARVQALEAAVAQWSEVARIEALALNTGAGVQSDLLRAQAGLFRASAGLARARADAVVARVELARIRGELTVEWIHQQLESR